MSDAKAAAPAIEAKWFREVLGQYPTGVCVITAIVEGQPTGMVVGSFTSVSLTPPLVAFFPDRNAGGWQRLKAAPGFCVNILAADQEPLCRKLASRDPDKFVGLVHRLSPGGAPIIDGAVAWLDCDTYSVTEAGDHFIVLGLVRQLEMEGGGLPLLFFQGGYGRFAPLSLMASDTHGLLVEQLRLIDCARPEMERTAADIGAQCSATIRVGDELIVAASAGQATRGVAAAVVGERLPFLPPLGSTFAAWMPQVERDRWIGDRLDAARRDAYRASLTRARERGFVVARFGAAGTPGIYAPAHAAGAAEADVAAYRDALIGGRTFEPGNMRAELDSSVRMLSAPVLDGDGTVAMALAVQGFAPPADAAVAAGYAERLLEGTARIGDLLHRTAGR